MTKTKALFLKRYHCGHGKSSYESRKDGSEGPLGTQCHLHSVALAEECCPQLVPIAKVVYLGSQGS